MARLSELERRHVHIGNMRLALFTAAIVAGFLALRSRLFSPWWLVLPLAGFIGLVAYHSRVLRARTLAERAIHVYRNGLARLADKWAGTGALGHEYEDPHHVYAADLDLFGSSSLFELLSLARTRMGERKLADWLLAPAPVEQIRDRQASVAELRDKVDLREELAVLGEDAGAGVHPEALLSWAESPLVPERKWLLPVARVLALFAIVAAVVWAVWDWALPFLLIVILEILLAYGLRKEVDEVLHGTEDAFEDLDLLSLVLGRLEQEEFSTARLIALSRQLSSHHVRGSAALTRLRKIVDLSMSRDNLFLRLLDIPLMYSVQVSIAAQRWRRDHGSAVRRWLDTIAEFEALLSLSGYSYEHPQDPFPDLVEGPGCFEAAGLGHPLLPAATCVRNDVEIGGARVLLISGSNMSGKSTLLRSIGVNTVLAMAGGPVRAKQLRLSPLQVGASIRINDSLQAGSSRFYAEITRLRQIYDLAGGSRPLLFLLDELLQGTNSKDRRVGAEGMVRALVAKGAIGLVSTHDLALTDIGGTLEGKLVNLHFEDMLQDGKISFDYRLRPGVVTKSNGLALMRSIGLDV